MNVNEKFIISINRESGSGGRSVGEQLAARLGVPFYSKAVIQGLQKKYNLTAEEIERRKGQDHSWWAELKRTMALGLAMAQQQYKYQMVNDDADSLTTDYMFKTEVEILQGIAESESCVVAGRSSFYVFRDHPNHLNILIQAPMEQRIARLVEKKGIGREEAQKLIDDVDRMRESYVRKYTGTSRYDTRNYDLVISMADHTIEDAVELIMKYIER